MKRFFNTLEYIKFRIKLLITHEMCWSEWDRFEKIQKELEK